MGMFKKKLIRGGGSSYKDRGGGKGPGLLQLQDSLEETVAPGRKIQMYNFESVTAATTTTKKKKEKKSSTIDGGRATLKDDKKKSVFKRYNPASSSTKKKFQRLAISLSNDYSATSASSSSAYHNNQSKNKTTVEIYEPRNQQNGGAAGNDKKVDTSSSSSRFSVIKMKPIQKKQQQFCRLDNVGSADGSSTNKNEGYDSSLEYTPPRDFFKDTKKKTVTEIEPSSLARSRYYIPKRDNNGKKKKKNKTDNDLVAGIGFQRLRSQDESPSNQSFAEYEPPADFLHFSSNKFDEAQEEEENEQEDRGTKRKKDHEDAPKKEPSEEKTEYEPPPDYFAKTKEAPSSNFEAVFSNSNEEDSTVASGDDGDGTVGEVGKEVSSIFDGDSNEFRQFVFGQDLRTIEKVVVERSDSGAGGDADIFRMAAVETVKQYAVNKVFESAEKNKKKPLRKPTFASPASQISPSSEKKNAPASDASAVSEGFSWNKFQQTNSGPKASTANANSLQRPPPPSTITTSTDFSVISTVSNTGATVLTDGSKAVNVMKHRFSGIKEEDNGGDDDPFMISEVDAVDDSAWNVADADPFGPRDDSLIMSIKKAASKEPRDPDAGNAKPDPSPRGNPIKSSIERVISTPQRPERMAKTMGKQHAEHKNKKKKNRDLSESSSGANRHGRVPPPFSTTHPKSNTRSSILSADFQIEEQENHLKSTASMTSSRSRSSAGKPPTAVPENAILASMLFRQTQSGNDNEASHGKQSKQDKEKVVPDEPSRRDEGPPSVVPCSVSTAEAAESIVSSVTEEASAFYHKNLQNWKNQANTVLNQYHKNRNNHPDSYRATDSRQQKPTTTGGKRPTWMSRVEEGHVKMFNHS